MSTLGPFDHIARTPLPWRTQPGLTECGKPVTDHPGHVLTRDEVQQRIRDLGQQRAAYTTCMTCVTTSARWTGFDPDHRVLLALGREVGAVEHTRPPLPPEAHADRVRWDRRQRLCGELRAITALINAHREEFEGYLTGLAGAVDLGERRRRRVTR